MGEYRNVMELLVEEEVIRQCRSLSPRVASYMNPTELVAFALNQLPPLYATTEQGLEYQMEKGRVKFATSIKQAVRRSIAAISRDPLRTRSPLSKGQLAPMREVLQQIRQVLKNDQIEWEMVPSAVESAIKQAAYRAAQRTASRITSDPVSPTPPLRPIATSLNSSVNRASGQAIARESTVRQDHGQSFGWDDPLYLSDR